jgi:hypothetical protein
MMSAHMAVDAMLSRCSPVTWRVVSRDERSETARSTSPAEPLVAGGDR